MSHFNEEALGEEIKRVWGEHGGHYDVYRELLKRAGNPDDLVSSFEEKQFQSISVLKIGLKKLEDENRELKERNNQLKLNQNALTTEEKKLVKDLRKRNKQLLWDNKKYITEILQLKKKLKEDGGA